MFEHDPIPTFTTGELSPSRVGAALREVGMFRLAGALHPLIAAQTYSFARDLFAVPDPEKRLALRDDENESGYTPRGVEGVVGYPPDMNRHFWDYKRHANRLPRCYDGLSIFFSMLFRDLETTAIIILDQIAESLGEPIARFSYPATGGNHLLRMSHYFAREPVPVIRFPGHRDFGLVTLYLGGAEPGLEIEVNGTWYPAQAPLGSLLVACGNILKMETGGVMPSVRHRVVGAPDDRYSIVFFTEPRSEVVLSNGETGATYLARVSKKVRPGG